jgi:signal transduction histidine kinase
MNFMGLLAALIRVAYILGFSSHHYSAATILVNTLPVTGSIAMMLLMRARAQRTTVFFSFLVFPCLLFAIGMTTHDRGIIMFFIPYFIYPFFFLNNIKKILLAFFLSFFFFAASIAIFLHNAGQIITHDLELEALSVIEAISLIFITLLSIKTQVWHYEQKIKEQKGILQQMNIDILSQKEKLQQSNHTKDKLFSIISHDLRIPIQRLLLLLSNTGEPGKGQQYIIDNLPLVRDELNTTTALSAKVKRSLGQRAVDKGIFIGIADTDCLPLYADKSILEVVLRNLVANSIKFTNKGGSVQIRGYQKRESYVIQVKDNRTGIDTGSLAKIRSKEFYTCPGTKSEKGTGMGLLICRELIEQCNGTLTIASIPGKGTTISISLPNWQPENKSTNQYSRRPSPPTHILHSQY